MHIHQYRCNFRQGNLNKQEKGEFVYLEVNNKILRARLIYCLSVFPRVSRDMSLNLDSYI